VQQRLPRLERIFGNIIVKESPMKRRYSILISIAAVFGISEAARADCRQLPSHEKVRTALAAAQAQANGGLGFHMWATLVDRDGIVCAVTYTGADRNQQWPGSRVISAQKANTANAFSLPGFALSTANLFSAVQPGGSLFGLQESNPVDVRRAYEGSAALFGTPRDPMAGQRIGGVNVFGGGLALYAANGSLLGAIGVSGDTSCADHIIAWRTRAALQLDHVPGGVASNTDNIIFDITNGRSAGGYGHPTCSPASTEIASGLSARRSQRR
jgi:uncharacterized protein GlcG (DUF336 family)